jgi:predicted HicB family RNase H-like nuclease
VGIVNLEITDELHRRARAVAVMRGESFKALVTRAIEREVERLEREGERRR